MTGTRSCWILTTWFLAGMTGDGINGTSRSAHPGGEHQLSPPQGSEPTRLSPLRVRPVVNPLSRRQLRLFFCLYARSYFGADPSKQERLAYIVEDANGEWTLFVAPRSGTYRRERYAGAVPHGTVGIVHTHPREGQSFGISPTDRRAVGIYRDVCGELVRVNWNYIIHAKGVLAVDSYGKKHVVAGRGWTSGLRAEARHIKLFESPPNHSN